MPPPQAYYQGAATLSQTASAVGRAAYDTGQALGFIGPEWTQGEIDALYGRGTPEDYAALNSRLQNQATGLVLGTIGNGPHLPGGGEIDNTIESLLARKMREGLTPQEIMRDPEFLALQAKSAFMPDYNATPEGPATAADITANLKRARAVEDAIRKLHEEESGGIRLPSWLGGGKEPPAQPFPELTPSEAAAAKAQALQQTREAQYGGVQAGQVQRTGQNAGEVVSGNAAAYQRGIGNTAPLSTASWYAGARENLLQRIQDAKPLQQQNAELLSQFRSRQAGAFTGAAQTGTGEAGFNRALGAMQGQAERVAFQPLRPLMQPEQVNQLFDAVTQSSLRPFEQATAGTALRNIIDGQVPTPSSLANLELVFPGITESLRKSNILPKDPLFQRALALAADIANTPRAIMASGDLSASLRQAAMAAPSHPQAWWQAMRDQVAAYRSLEGAQAAMERIDAHPLRGFLDDMNVAILPIDSNAPFSAREEAFMSRLANRIPLVERSQRAYTTAMNSMRAGVSYDILGNLSPEQLAAMTPQRLEKLGSFVNAITGRGDIPAMLDKYQPELNALFFSPRNTFGKVQANLSVLSRDPLVRKEAAKSLGTFYATGIGILAAAHLAGLKVGLTPGSADFGKIVLPGGTRLDIWGGNAQLFRMIANLATGDTVTSTGQRFPQGRLDTVGRFLRNKLAPVPSEGVTIASGENAIGQKWEPSQLPGDLLRMVTPLFLQDLVASFQQGGPVEGAIAGVGSFFGVGAQAQADSLTAKVKAGQYTSLQGADQLKAVPAEGWRLLQNSPSAPDGAKAALSQYASYYDWLNAARASERQRAAQMDVAEAQRIYDAAKTDSAKAKLDPVLVAVAMGGREGEITSAIDRSIGRMAIAKAYDVARAHLEEQWVRDNPELTLKLYDQYQALQTADEKRAHSDWNFNMKQRALAQSLVPQNQRTPEGRALEAAGVSSAPPYPRDVTPNPPLGTVRYEDGSLGPYLSGSQAYRSPRAIGNDMLGPLQPGFEIGKLVMNPPGSDSGTPPNPNLGTEFRNIVQRSMDLSPTGEALLQDVQWSREDQGTDTWAGQAGSIVDVKRSVASTESLNAVVSHEFTHKAQQQYEPDLSPFVRAVAASGGELLGAMKDYPQIAAFMRGAPPNAPGDWHNPAGWEPEHLYTSVAEFYHYDKSAMPDALARFYPWLR